MTSEHEKRRLVDWLRAEMNRQAGRRYLIDLEALDLKSLRELQRLLRDLNAEARMAAQRARIQPFRRLTPPYLRQDATLTGIHKIASAG